MKVLLILLLVVHAFWAASAATTNGPLSEDLSRKCEAYCLTFESGTRIKELEAKVTELEGKLATLNESKVEYEEKVELKNDLFDDLNAKLDVMQNKVRGILQVNSKNKTKTVVHYTE